MHFEAVALVLHAYINNMEEYMKKFTVWTLAFMLLISAVAAFAEEEALETTTAYRYFVNSYRNVRTVKVIYYDNVYAYNHGDYYMTPFDSNVPAEYFVKDANGNLCIAPIVLDVTDAMRIRLYGEDVGETAMYYGQYCERINGKRGKSGFSGIHEGIDFVSYKGSDLHAILGGEVTKAGDSNGTIGIYNEDYDITLLYLHCQNIKVKRGQVVEAGDLIGEEGGKAIYAGRDIKVLYMKNGWKHVHTSHYTHVEMRIGRHTSSNKYRNAKLESDCPYEVMKEALEVVESGRQPISDAAVREAQRIREEELLKLEATPEPTPEPTPAITVVDEVPESAEGYGFAEEAAETPAPEATLPPSM